MKAGINEKYGILRTFIFKILIKIKYFISLVKNINFRTNFLKNTSLDERMRLYPFLSRCAQFSK